MRQLLLLTLFFMCCSVHSQNNGEDTLGNWYAYFGNNKIGEKTGIHTELQARYYDRINNFNQFIFRLGLNYKIQDNVNSTFGYGYLSTDNSFEDLGEPKVSEHQFFEQIAFSTNIWELKIRNRYRFEQRFIDFGDTNDTQFRARAELRVIAPLTNTFYLNILDEVFINLQNDAFSLNWFFAGIGIKITENTTLELGYRKLHFPNVHYDRIQVNLMFNPDLRNVFKSNKTN